MNAKLFSGMTLIALTLLNFSKPQAHAQPPTTPGGVDVGNGGSGVLCSGHLSLYDFWEGENVSRREVPHTLTIPRSQASVDEQLELAAQRLDDIWPAYGESFREQVQSVRSLALPLGPNVRLPETNDLGFSMSSENCTRVQIANYVVREVDGVILYVSDQIHRMPPTDQAGLWAHEAIYKLERFWGATTSEHTRKLVGLLFSEQAAELTRAELGRNRPRDVPAARFPGHRFLIPHPIPELDALALGSLVPTAAEFPRATASEVSGLWEYPISPGGYYKDAILRIDALPNEPNSIQWTSITLAQPFEEMGGTQVYEVVISHGSASLLNWEAGHEVYYKKWFGPNLVVNEGRNARVFFENRKQEMISGRPIDASAMHRTGPMRPGWDGVNFLDERKSILLFCRDVLKRYTPDADR